MELILGTLFALGLGLALFWLLSLQRSVARDKADALRQQAEAREQEERAAQRALLHRKGEPLRCLGCNASFPGPLPEDGCPQCHCALLVVTEREANSWQHEPPR